MINIYFVIYKSKSGCEAVNFNLKDKYYNEPPQSTLYGHRHAISRI